MSHISDDLQPVGFCVTGQAEDPDSCRLCGLQGFGEGRIGLGAQPWLPQAALKAGPQQAVHDGIAVRKAARYINVRPEQKRSMVSRSLSRIFATERQSR